MTNLKCCNKKNSVLLGFSGGVDSTAAALELRDAGYDVYLETLDTNGDRAHLSKATNVANQIGIPLNITDVSGNFRERVIDYFLNSYLRGETPAPCTVCNLSVKWYHLYEIAKAKGYDKIATGHYFRIHQLEGKFFVRKGADSAKDQSYYLWSLPQNYLAKALTPMGDKLKSEVKAEHSHLVNSPESMGVCFLRGANYADFLRLNIEQIDAGDITDRSGEVVGRHSGCAFYTIGQKKGLDCTKNNAVVVDIMAERNIVVIGSESDLYCQNLLLQDCVAPDLDRLLGSKNAEVKIRGFGKNPDGFATIEVVESSTHSGLNILVKLSGPAWAAAKGQPAVIYEGDIVLGGGYLYDYY